MKRGACALVALAALAACGHELELPEAPPPPPPEISAVEADPGLARAGTELAISVIVRGDPGGDPTVDVDGTPAEKLTGPDASGRFAYRYVARGSEEQGRDVAVRATLRTGATSSVPVRFDFEPPGLASARIQPSTPVRIGTELLFGLTAKEELGSATVRLVGRDARCEARSSGLEWRCTLAIADGDPEGEQLASARLVDLAGNEAEEALPDPVRLDFACALDATRTRLQRGAGLVASFEAEPGAFEPDATVELLADPAGEPLARALAGAEGEVAPVDLGGDVAAVLVRATDQAGNATEPAQVPRTYVAGFTWPAAAAAAPNPTTLRCMGTGDTCASDPAERMLPSLVELQAAQDLTSREVFARLAAADDDGEMLVAARLGGEGVSFFRDLAARWAPSARLGHRLVEDGAGGRVLLIGGLDLEAAQPAHVSLWAWDGTRWTDLSTTTAGQRPPWRQTPAAAFDPLNGNVVVFGGQGSSLLADTWTLDGSTWRQHTAPALGAPSARTGAAMAFHPPSGRLVLFGGGAELTLFDDTWTWDGAGWTRADVAGCDRQPAPRAFHSMGYDPGLGEVVLFGGVRGTMLDDAWGFDGTCWRPLAAPVGPGARAYHAMTWSAAAGGFVVFGGWDRDLAPLGDTWLLRTQAPRTASWTELAPRSAPGRRWGAAMAVDDASTGRAVLFGGFDPGGQGPFADTWRFDGTTWSRAVAAGADLRVARDGAALAAEPGGVAVLVGGRGESGTTAAVCRLEGDAWSCNTPAAGEAWPSARWGAALAAAPGGDGLLIFGGMNNATELSDLWRRRSASWALLGREPLAESNLPAEAENRTWPIGRVGHAAIHDPVRDRFLLFGGQLSPLLGGALADTWVFDGTTWDLVDADLRPPARSGHSLAWDEGRERAVLFGGKDHLGVPLGDTWEWDGERWSQVHPEWESPAPRARHSLSYDPVLGKVVLFGGEADGAALGDAWEWDGARWVRRTSWILPPPRAGHGMVHDPTRGASVLVGGSTAGETLADTWEYRPRGSFPALLASFDVAATGLADAARATLTAVSAGGGRTEGEPRKLHGVRVSIWAADRWRLAGENRASPYDAGEARTLRAGWTREELQPLLLDGKLHVLLVPLRGASTGAPGAVEIDHLELRLDE